MRAQGFGMMVELVRDIVCQNNQSAGQKIREKARTLRLKFLTFYGAASV